MPRGRNADPNVLTERKSRIWDAHVAPINGLADEIAAWRNLEPGLVPYVDPDQGGIHARVLLLLDNPSTMAEAGTGSGLLSLDNDDGTASNLRAALARHNIDWKLVTSWNVCPFPTANGKNSDSLKSERTAAAPWTRRLISLLPQLEIVLPFGVPAREGWRKANIRRAGLHDFDGIEIPHPSRRGFAATSPNGKVVFEDAIRATSVRLGVSDRT